MFNILSNIQISRGKQSDTETRSCETEATGYWISPFYSVVMFYQMSPLCPRLDTQPCHETFYNIHFWIGLSLQSKKSIRTLTRGEYNLFEKYFHLFTIIWNLVNLVKWQFWRISHDLTAGESQDIGSCQNWNLREMIWGFSNFWN